MARLDNLAWLPSPHCYRGRSGTTVDLVVVHYTAGRGDENAAARLFASPTRKASAHFVVGRTGGVVQCVDTDDTAWHAGDSGRARVPEAWQLDDANGAHVLLEEVRALPRHNNLRSIGVELCNRGWAPRGPGRYATARHRNPASRSTLWESYPDEQIDSLRRLVARLQAEHPSLRYVTGHEDCTHEDTLGEPGAKLDPGPLFPWRTLTSLGLKRIAYDFDAHAWRCE